MNEYSNKNRIWVKELSLDIPKELEQEVLAAAAKALRQPESMDSRLSAARKYVHVLGVSGDRLDKANFGQLKRALEEEWLEHRALCLAVLEAWFNQNQNLRAVCTAWFETLTPEQVQSYLDTSDQENARIRFDSAARMVVTQTDKKTNLDRVRLGLAVVVGPSAQLNNPPEPAGMNEPAKAAAGPLLDTKDQIRGEAMLNENTSTGESQPAGSLDASWDNLLEIIRAISASDPAWQTVDDFVLAVKRIENEKEMERSQAQKTDRLAGILYERRQALTEKAAYLGITGVEEWAASVCPLDQVDTVIQQLDHLHERLKAHYLLVENPRLANRDERVSWESELRRVEDEIIAGFQSVNSFFLSSQLASVKQTSTLPEPISEIVQEMPPAALDSILPSEQRKPETALELSPLATEDLMEDMQDVEAEVSAYLSPSVSGDREADLFQGALDVETTGLTVVSEVQNTFLSADLPVVEQMGEDEKDIDPYSPSETEAPWINDPVESSANQVSVFDSQYDEQADESVVVSQLTVDEAAESQPEGDLDQTNEIVNDVRNGSRDAARMVPVKEVIDEVQNSTSSRYIAAQLMEGADGLNWADMVSALIIEDDLPAAYWLAQGLEFETGSSPLPSQLIAAIQGSRWLNSDLDILADNLLDISKSFAPKQEKIMSLYTMAAALRPSLITPFSGLLSWLEPPYFSSEFEELAKAVMEFTNLGLPLHETDVDGVSGAEQRRAELDQSIEDAQRWLNEAPLRRTKLKRATDVWRYLSGPEGELRKLIKIAGEDRRNEVDIAKEIVTRWQQSIYANAQIDEIDETIYRLKTRAIVGSPRAQILRDINETIWIATRWYRAVEHEQEIETRGDWLFEHVAELRQSMTKLLPPVEETLRELCNLSQPITLIAPAKCLLRSIYQVREALHLEPGQDEDAPQKWSWLCQDTLNLMDALNRKLLWLPELELADDGTPDYSDYSCIPQAILGACQTSRTMEKAFILWMEKQDYRFAPLMSALLSSSENPLKFQEELSSSRFILRESKNRIQGKIEQAVVDGIISDERSEYSALLERIDPDQVFNFPPYHRSLNDLLEKLNQGRQRRLNDLTTRWQSMLVQLTSSSLPPEQCTQVTQLINASLERGDTRLVEEYLASVERALDSGGVLDEKWEQPVSHRDELAEFNRLSGRLEDWIKDRNLDNVAHEIRDGVTRAGIKFGEISVPRRIEAEQTLQAWRYLKPQRERANVSIRVSIAAILRYLGFTFETRNQESVQIEKHGEDWLYARVWMSDVKLSKPIPQFGSQAKGIYHLICLWERPGADTIATRLRELRLNLDSVIVLYLGRLTLRQRYDLIRTSNDQELAIAVVDELLLVYLAQERDTRLPTFLRCALPFAALNPYTPFQAGDVPPEMFYGREDMVRELQRSNGSCLVYGGRQLGKSALLRQVEREFLNPARKQFARVMDIKLIGDPTTEPMTDGIWRKLRDYFKDLGLISERVYTEKPEEIERYLRDAMLADINRRVLVLFDEADNFLAADAKDNFRITERLRTLMVDTNRRFKVVFAGLHNVQRFQGLPNQPLAHFGTPLLVGPLDAHVAMQLIREPLFYLGYRFADDTDPLRILSYTNYHPGLIQLFCQELLVRLRNRNNKLPPYIIEQNDIEAIYLQVKERVRERFDWTLALDKAYQAIAWSLIENQMQLHDSYAQAYPPAEILKLVRSWWPQGFEKIDLVQLRSLLGEMIGLGVLVKDYMGNYRLRSPNLVRLMGTDAEIETMLLELAEQPAYLGIESDHYHTLLDETTHAYSPLTYDQERNLKRSKFGVGLVFASDALGLDVLPKVFERFVIRDRSNVHNLFDQVPLWVTDDNDLRTWLEQQLRRNQDKENLVFYLPVGDCKPTEAACLVQGGLDFCRSRRSSKQHMTLLFLFDAKATLNWLQLTPEQYGKLEDQVDASIYPRLWNISGIRQRLAQSDKIFNDKVCQSVLTATGGWPMLLDEIFNRAGKKDDPREIAEAVAKELTDKKSTLASSFQKNLGLKGSGLPEAFLKIFLQGDRIPIEYVTPELITVDDVTQQDCDSALEFLVRMNFVLIDNDAVMVDPLVKRVSGS